MKKLWSSLMMMTLSVGMLVGCGGTDTTTPAAGSSEPKQEAKKDEFPNKPITLTVSFKAGGGTDLGARILAPYLEKELGVPVVVENKPGAGGWTGYSELLRSKADGYTIGYVNTPGLITGYLNPTANRKENLDSFDYIANHVVDAGVIAVKADENRFSTIEELIEYAKKNKVTATTNGVGTGNHFVSLQLNGEFGTQINPVHMEGTGEAITAVMGGHVDILVAKVGEVVQPQKDGQIKVLAVTMNERVPQLPDVPTLKETVGEVENYSIRGIAAPKGIDPQVMEKLQSAFEKALKDPEHIKKMEEMGLNVAFYKGEDFKQLLKKEESTVLEYKSLIGW
ncbi:tripartite tricarboxylate transporter substrate binding protein [Ammoniphilus sp. CFH 90114]|uniref:tripartite tricarboxylate transporter substrate binding protein n=1 Tax=Ammoniphilus sp. CFH 90114 TaxID=2493665 RepID=UPI00100FE8E0|nr:tripartite tricarboxylate transporter substrate binding protein [Ammoniphilus sp. CFH 90114]RXT03929.1 tripartite tricarboxylate transporter substrate binding protein [Ammoniphilus sp. CFH 90114]